VPEELPSRMRQHRGAEGDDCVHPYRSRPAQRPRCLSHTKPMTASLSLEPRSLMRVVTTIIRARVVGCTCVLPRRQATQGAALHATARDHARRSITNSSSCVPNFATTGRDRRADSTNRVSRSGDSEQRQQELRRTPPWRSGRGLSQCCGKRGLGEAVQFTGSMAERRPERDVRRIRLCLQ
jgi:hypothetical protein